MYYNIIIKKSVKKQKKSTYLAKHVIFILIYFVVDRVAFSL